MHHMEQGALPLEVLDNLEHSPAERGELVGLLKKLLGDLEQRASGPKGNTSLP